MRKGGLILLVFVLLIFGGISFFIDGFIEKELEAKGTESNGALVEFGEFNFSFFKSQLSWTNLQTANPDNPWENTFETGYCELDVEIMPLLARKLIINDMVVNDLLFNTTRDTDGGLVSKEDKKDKSKDDENETEEDDGFDIKDIYNPADPDSLLDLVNPDTPEKVDSLLTVYKSTYAELNKQVDSLPEKEELRQIEAEIKALKLKDIKDIGDLEKKLKEVKKIYKKLKKHKKTIKSLKDDIESNYSDFNKHPELVKDWVKADYRKAKDQVDEMDISLETGAGLLFGNEVSDKMTRYISIYKKFKKWYKSSSKKDKDNPERGTGQDIEFSEKSRLPNLWIKNINLSGTFNSDLDLQGIISDISSNQDITKKPIMLNIETDKYSVRKNSLSGLIDFMDKKEDASFDLAMAGFSLADRKLSDSAILPFPLNSGIGSLTANISALAENYECNFNFIAEGLEFNTQDSGGRFEKAADSKLALKIASEITDINVDGIISSIDGKYSTKLNSNLDNIIKDQAKEAGKEALNEQNEKLQARIDDDVKKYTEKLTSGFESQKEDLMDSLNLKSDDINTSIDVLDDKEDEIKKKLKDLTGGLLKF